MLGAGWSAAGVLDAPLIAGPLPTAISLAGALAAPVLLAARGRRWWIRRVPIALACGMTLAAVCALFVAVAHPFPDPLPVRMLSWLAVFGSACALLVLGWPRIRWRRRVLGLLSVLVVTATCLVKANAFYGYRPTLAAAFGIPAANQVELADLPQGLPLVSALPRRSLAADWHAPPGMPAAGSISQVPLPGLRSGFPARSAWVYLPPAYLSSPRARLPVLVLVPGQPGGPEDWILAGQLPAVMDRFAAAHNGLAPVVIVPDVTGSAWGNTLCMDSRLGAADTYLARDVPAWAATTLQVDTSRMAVGGFSFGGTCALQMAVRHPDVYATFLDISGEAHPTLGDRARTVNQAFGGDQAAFDRVDPLTVLRARRLPGSAGVVATGRDDRDYGPQATQVVASARAAAMTIAALPLPGGHTWANASLALSASLPWISSRTGILDSTPPPGQRL